MLSFVNNDGEISPKINQYILNIIKKEIKENLKIKTTITLPHSLVDGELVTEIIYDNEVINKEVQKIKLGSTIFSF